MWVLGIELGSCEAAAASSVNTEQSLQSLSSVSFKPSFLFVACLTISFLDRVANV